ncbi:hypothetical protein BH20BAC1_BH20BAC1_17870 [soil metagenome]
MNSHQTKKPGTKMLTNFFMPALVFMEFLLQTLAVLRVFKKIKKLLYLVCN